MGVFICQGCGSELTHWTGACVHCGTTEIIKLGTATDRMIDRLISGRFRILRKLGQGGMGAVYLAEQTGIGQKVALKFLKSDLSSDAEIVRRFLNEAKSYAKVAHPNAVTLHDFGQDEENNLFIAMEFCEGDDLKRVLAARGRLSLEDAVDVALQVADVLAHAHHKGVVHRDLKPENIMVRQGMRGLHVKVLDFGIARLMGESTKLTLQGSIAGTPRYMAPEQVEGKEIDHRVDVYALGVLLFELLTGVQPFDGQTVTEILRNQVLKPLPKLGDCLPELDFPALDEVLQRACAKSREDRYGDMSQLAHALVQALPTQAHGMALQPPVDGAAGFSETLVRGKAPSATELAQDTEFEAAPGPFEAPPKASRGPLVVSGLAALVLLIVAGTLVAKNGASTAPPPAPVVALAPPPPVVEPPKVVPPALPPAVEPVAQPMAERVRMRALDFMARAETAYKAGDFVTAEVYLKEVPEEPEFRAKADQLRDTLKELNRRLSSAKAKARRGECDAAIAEFDAILKVNGNLREAQAGKARCREALPPSSFE